MRIADIVKISQGNLFHSKLRTFLTVAAIFVGSLTLSLTNGLGNGIKAYVNAQLGNLGAKDIIIVQAKQTQDNPTSTNVVKYDPDKKTGTFSQALLTPNDLDKISKISGITKVIPQYPIQIEYIYTGGDKYQASAEQFLDGLNLQMSAGTTLNPNSGDEMTIPARYIKPGEEQSAVGKYAILGYKNSDGKIVEKNVKITGIQQGSLLGNGSINVSTSLAKEISEGQTAGIATLANSYGAAAAFHDPNFSATQTADLKKHLDEAGYTGQTLEDSIGTIGKVINTILYVLDAFALITLLAAAFGIVNTLLMSVNERTSEIGLMKALGANRRTIFSIFAIEAASIGFWGALIGIAVSIGIGNVASKIAAHTFLKNFVGFRLLAFPFLPSLYVLLGIMILAFLAGTLPSLKASKLDPIKALRYE